MSYALVQDIAASWHDYEQIAAALVEPAPTGLLLHAERLEPAIARLGGPVRPQPTFRDLHTAHLVVGERDAWRSPLTHAQEDER